jgi:drug/metabolite transporter (DMT)-like permease
VREARPGGSSWTVHLALAAAQTGFALFPIFGKLALVSIPPFVIAAIRVVSSAAMLEIVRRFSPSEPVRREDRRLLMTLAILGVSLNQVLFIVGLSLTSAINTTILISSIPAFTLTAAVLLGREALTRRALVGTLLAGAGALVLLNAERFDWGSRFFRGNLLILANSLSYSLYLVLARPLLARYSALAFTAAVFRYGTLPILAVSIPALAVFSPQVPARGAWWSLGAVVLFSTAVPYFLNSWALARVSASRVATYVFLQPVIAATLAILVLGERPGWRTGVAAALVFAGLGVSLRPGVRSPLTTLSAKQLKRQELPNSKD